MTHYLHCLSLLADADRDLARADGWTPRFSPFAQGLVLHTPARIAQCAWALERSKGAANVAARIADAARTDAELLARRVAAASDQLPALREECLLAPPFAGLDPQTQEEIWQALTRGEDVRPRLLTLAPAATRAEHPAALEGAVRHLRALARACSLEAAYRELAGNPLGLRLPGPIRVLDQDELTRVRWSPGLRTIGSCVLAGGIELGVARTVAGAAVVGRRQGDAFIAEDIKGFAAFEYVQVEHGLWDQAFREYKEDAPRQRALAAILERAVSALTDGSPVAAQRHFEEAHKLESGHLVATLGLVEARLIERSPHALPEATKALSLAPGDPRALFLHARALRTEGQEGPATLALEAAQHALEADMSGPLFGDAMFWLPSDLLLRARILFETGQLEAARAGFEAVIATQSETATALVGLGQTHLKTGAHAQALKAFQDALAIRPTLSTARQGAAQALLAMDEPEPAIEMLFSLAQWCFGQGWPSGALACHEQILAIAPQHTASLAGAGFALDKLQRAKEAAEYFHRAADIYVAQGRYSDAVSHCDYALARNGLLLWAMLCRGLCQVRLGEWAEGLASLNAALRIDPACREALVGKAEVHIANWEYGAAADCLDQVLEKHPTHVGALVAAGQLELLNADYTMAAIHFSLALREGPGHVGAQLGLAECQLAQGDFVEAFSGFNQVLARDPDNSRAQTGRTQALRGLPPEVAGIGPLLEAADHLAKRERWADALVLYSAVAAYSPSSTHALSGIAQTQMKLQDYPAALVSLRKLHALGEADTDSRLRLGQSLLALRDHGEALEVFKSLLESTPDRLEALIGKAQALEGLGHWNEALGCYAGALQIDEQNIDGYIGKGRMHMALSELDAARRSFACALAIQPGHAAALQGQRHVADLERS